MDMKRYENGIADERDRIIKELENRIEDEVLGIVISDVGIGLRIVR